MIVPPPFLCQQRAWECAYVLRHEFAADLSLSIEEAYRAGPERDARRLFTLHRRTAGVRV